MSSRPTSEQRILEQAAERKMRLWTLEGEVARRLRQEGRRERPLAQYFSPWIAISRQAGAGGSILARRVADRLGWEVLDRQLLDFMARRYRLPRRMIEVVDETTANWFHEIFAKWLDRRSVTQTEYALHLARIILLAAQHGPAVFVGRGAQFLLPADRGTAIRLVSDPDERTKRIAEGSGLTASEARRRMREIDRGRDAFVRRYYDRDASDPLHYDLVIHVDRVGLDEAADLVVQVARGRRAAVA